MRKGKIAFNGFALIDNVHPPTGKKTQQRKSKIAS